MKAFLCPFAMLLCCALLPAQSSENYQIEQGTFNNGGNPAPILTSDSYQMTLDSIGDGIAAVGLSSPSYGMDPGFPSAYPPPGEVLDLRFTGATTLVWAPEPAVGSYNLYRGTLSALPGSYGTREQSGIPGPTTTDATAPGAGQCLIYLVTASNRLSEEGTKGTDSNGDFRP